MSYHYQKLPNNPGIYKHKSSGNYLAQKKIKGKTYRKTFTNLSAAKRWRNLFNGKEPTEKRVWTTSTLKEVWSVMQVSHFPTLAESTKAIWHRRFSLLEQLEHLHMEQITPSKITTWVKKNVKHFKSEDYVESGRGKAKRCNLDNELNLLVTIFNWYKDSEEFEIESTGLECPVKKRHKKEGFIRPRPIKNKKITLDDALKFFSYLKPLYRDLALIQYYTASRIGEAAGLQWSRVDFENNKIVIMETCQWDMTKKTYVGLNPHPKNKEPRIIHMTNELREILKRRLDHKEDENNFVFHVEGKPLNYSTIQLNYREAQRKGRIPYSGTHILRHGMATLARQVGGGLDAVIAMTGHKDYKLADHYSKLDSEYQKELSEKIMRFINTKKGSNQLDPDNVIEFARYATLD